MTKNDYQPIFQFNRGNIVKSVHFGAIAVVDSSGKLVARYGNPGLVTFTRSSAKPFQALPFIEYGGMKYYGLTLQEVALLCASHSGTDEHLAVVRSIQKKTGVSEEELLCGVHTPYSRATAEAMRERGEKPTPNRHNCSGKHTGMIAFSHMLGYPIEPDGMTYIDIKHPVQMKILASVAEMSDYSFEKIQIGSDGCSAPNFALPLQNTALAFARLCQPGGMPKERADACQLITNAMVSYPEMIGGPDNFDTDLMQVGKGRIVCKGGAEGFQAFGIMPGVLKPGSPALGIAFKVSDGDLKGHNRPYGDPTGHVRPAVTLEILRQLGALDLEDFNKLAHFGPEFPVENLRKLKVGWASPCFKIDYKQ